MQYFRFFSTYDGKIKSKHILNNGTVNEAVQHGEFLVKQNREARSSVGEILADIEHIDKHGHRVEKLSDNSPDAKFESEEEKDQRPGNHRQSSGILEPIETLKATHTKTQVGTVQEMNTPRRSPMKIKKSESSSEVTLHVAEVNHLLIKPVETGAPFSLPSMSTIRSVGFGQVNQMNMMNSFMA